jgi:Asp-tRNA(Asn)/Glu-tRNA(Gln) amidotransferase A subunit family amidase
MKTLAGSLDTVGLFARSVRDAAFFASALSGRPALTAWEEAPAPRIGVFRTAFWDKADAATVDALQRTSRALTGSGATVTDLPVPKEFAAIIECHRRMMGREMVAALSYEWLHLRDKITERTRQSLTGNADVTLEQYDEAVEQAPLLYAIFERLFQECDVLLTPAAVGEAPHGLDSTGDPTFNCGWTLLRVPCVTVPAGTGPLGLPVGVQIVGRRGQDARTLAAASFVESILAKAGIAVGKLQG